MKVDSYKCDECGTEKRSTNHWFVMVERKGLLTVGAWDNAEAYGIPEKHICGQQCAQKVLEQWMQGK